MKQIIISFTFFMLLACNNNKINEGNDIDKQEDNTPIQNVIKKYDIEIIDTIPHNPNYYTQGLIFHNGILYEGTGNFGKSALIKYKKDNHTVDKIINLEHNIFGEGITILNDKIYQISWLNQICFVYNLNTFKKENELTYAGEGWGITNNDSILIMSDGSANIKFIEPNNFTILKNLVIKREGNNVRLLNELELIDTLLYANIYTQDLIIIANINTGEVVGEIDISMLRQQLYDNPKQEVSNGIAFDKKNNIFYLTGKNWNKMFAVRFKEKK